MALVLARLEPRVQSWEAFSPEYSAWRIPKGRLSPETPSEGAHQILAPSSADPALDLAVEPALVPDVRLALV